MASTPTTLKPGEPATVTGVQLMQGIGHREAKGFWADAWSQVVHQPRAMLALAWISTIAFFAAFAPVLASGHPLIFTQTLPDGSVRTSYPLLENLRASDILLVLAAAFGGLLFLVPLRRFGVTTGQKLGIVLSAMGQGAMVVFLGAAIRGYVEQRSVSPWIRDLEQSPSFTLWVSVTLTLVSAAAFVMVPMFRALWARAAFVLVVGLVASAAVGSTWKTPPAVFAYRAQVEAGKAEATFTLIPWSPVQRATNLRLLEPGSDPLTPERTAFIEGELRRKFVEAEAIAKPKIDAARAAAEAAATARGRTPQGVQRAGDEAELAELRAVRAAVRAEHQPALEARAREQWPTEGQPRFVMGTDAIGQDVISQMMYACRLSISIGLVSTGIAVAIGVTIGALMGYFGGWIDTLLFRVVEIFMAIPVLFLLIVAAAVLPRNTYVMMIIIGCVTWTGAARFTRAEFMRLRNQDFVQAAQAVGLPLRSILFKHMLPNGVTPVLVDASFAIAAAIQIEAVLSFLSLGPAEQPSWGRLLASATNEVGEFKWWLAIFPGFAIFLTALSYNLLGECLRDAIDPKLKKARV